jgi:hypothetical protein
MRLAGAYKRLANVNFTLVENLTTVQARIRWIPLRHFRVKDTVRWNIIFIPAGQVKLLYRARQHAILKINYTKAETTNINFQLNLCINMEWLAELIEKFSFSQTFIHRDTVFLLLYLGNISLLSNRNMQFIL